MSQVVTRFEAGARVGDYRVDREVAREDTGIVYDARHVVLPRQVALKVMHAGNEWLRSVAVQMLREACLLEALAHPGVPRVYECGVLPDKRPWMAREWVDGASLFSVMQRGPLPVVDLVVLVRDLAELLAHAHGRGVVHRGLAPETIMMTPKRHFSVCVRRWDQALTLDTDVEVNVDARDDVLALGLIAFRALTGGVRHGTESAAQRYPAAPTELTALIDDMMHADPARRPSSEDARDRARWLAATIVPLAPAVRRRMTSQHDAVRVPGIEDDPSGFSVKIRRG